MKFYVFLPLSALVNAAPINSLKTIAILSASFVAGSSVQSPLNPSRLNDLSQAHKPKYITPTSTSLAASKDGFSSTKEIKIINFALKMVKKGDTVEFKTGQEAIEEQYVDLDDSGKYDLLQMIEDGFEDYIQLDILERMYVTIN
jgi:hypothetical protein